MAKYDVYPNPSDRGYLLDLQSDLLEGIASRVVAPLVPTSATLRAASRLNPAFEIEGGNHILLTQSMSAVPVRILNKPVANLSAHHDEITNALDMVFVGF